MKRIIAILLAVMMLSALCAVCSTANDICEPYGDVPKIPLNTIRLDGEMEAVYQQGLRVGINRKGKDSLSDAHAINGEAYFLYDDDNLYIYVIVNDDEYGIDFDSYFHICPIDQLQQRVQAGCEHVTEQTEDKRNIWDDDCVEVFIDWENDGEGSPRQMRTSRHGEMTYNWSTKDTGFNAKGKDYGSYWCAEYAIPLEMSSRGTQIGVDIMLHNQIGFDPYDEYWVFADNSSETGNSWESMYYDYIILGADLSVPVDPDPIIPDPVDPDPSNPNPVDPDPSNPNPANPKGTTSKNPTGPKPTETKVVVKSSVNENGEVVTETVIEIIEKDPPKTADPIVMIVLAAVMSLGAALVVKKTCFHK